MGRRRKTEFADSLYNNMSSYRFYLNRIMELAMSQIGWDGLPDTVDERYIELTLFKNASVTYFNDEIIGDLCLQAVADGPLNQYGNPSSWYGLGDDGYMSKQLDNSNAVIIYNNMLRFPDYPIAARYARRLYNFDQIIDVNANAQKTPVIIQCDNEMRLTLLNLYKQFTGNEPMIATGKNLDLNNFKVLRTDAPYIADKIQLLKNETWNECLTRLGIPNMQVTKKERLITDEVNQMQGGVIASRFSRMQARKDAAERINKMFGTNIQPYFRSDRYLEEREEETSLRIDEGNAGEE